MHHVGDLAAAGDNLEYCRTVRSVGGSLDVRAQNAELGDLDSVGGNVSILATGAGLRSLRSVGGSLYVYAALNRSRPSGASGGTSTSGARGAR